MYLLDVRECLTVYYDSVILKLRIIDAFVVISYICCRIIDKYLL